MSIPQDFLTNTKLCVSFNKDSTHFWVSYLIDETSNGVDSSLQTGMILIDLQKLFETIDHNVLLQKMASLKFSNEMINWVRPSRKFYINVHHKFSTCVDLRYEVSQEPILGHLLFLN